MESTTAKQNFAAYPDAPPPVSIEEAQLQTAVGRLQNLAGNLDRALAVHSDRLSPVLRPTSPEPVAAMAQAVNTGSPLAGAVATINDQISAFIGFVDRLTARLDV